MRQAILYLVFYFLLIGVSSCKKEETKVFTSPSTIVYQDSLAVDNLTWVSDSTSFHVRKFYQGHYSIREDSINSSIGSFAPYGTLNFPYSVQVTGIIQLDDPNRLGAIGVILNYKDTGNYTIVQIISNGAYFIGAARNGVHSTIVQPTVSTAIHTGSGAANTIKITQNAITLDLTINDQTIGSYLSILESDFTQVAIFTATTPNSSFYFFTPVTGLFNNFILTKI